MKRTLRQAFECHAAALFAGRCNSISETGKECRRVMQVGEWSLYLTRVVKTKGISTTCLLLSGCPYRIAA